MAGIPGGDYVEPSAPPPIQSPLSEAMLKDEATGFTEETLNSVGLLTFKESFGTPSSISLQDRSWGPLGSDSPQDLQNSAEQTQKVARTGGSSSHSNTPLGSWTPPTQLRPRESSTASFLSSTPRLQHRGSLAGDGSSVPGRVRRGLQRTVREKNLLAQPPELAQKKTPNPSSTSPISSSSSSSQRPGLERAPASKDLASLPKEAQAKMDKLEKKLTSESLTHKMQAKGAARSWRSFIFSTELAVQGLVEKT